MSQTIENKVVEMRFDNQQFEQNVKQSMASLDQLNASLDSIGNQNGNAFSGITDALNNLQVSVSKINPVRWKIWGDIIGVAENVGRTIVSKISTPLSILLNGGELRAQRIENAKFQFEGLGMDVEKAMKSATEAVNDTAYSLDAAASVASQLGASGVQAGDEMTKALTAVSGVAAMTNSSYEEIGAIFTQVAGAGRLTGDALTRLSYRGMNAAAKLGEAMGKTEGEIRKMTSKGQISFKQFYTAMYDAFGEHAYKANETYAGSLANINAALSKIGADFKQYKIRDMVPIFNSTRLAVNKLRKELTPVSELYGKISKIVSKIATDTIDKLDFKWLRPIFDGVANIIINLINVGKVAKQVFAEIFPKNMYSGIERAAVAFRDFTERIMLSNEGLNQFKSIIKGIIAFFDIIFTVISQIVKAIFPATEGLGGLAEGIIWLAAKIGDLLVAFDEWLHKTDAITIAINYLKDILLAAVTVIIGLGIKFVDFVKQIKDSEIVAGVINKITDAINGLKKATGGDKSSESKTGGIFGTVTDTLKKFKEGCESVIGEITPTKIAIAAIVATMGALVIAVLVVANKLANSVKILGNSLNFFDKAKKFFADYKKTAQEAADAAEKKAKFAKFVTVVGLLVALAATLKSLASQPLDHILAATVSMLAIIAVIWRMTESVSEIPKSAEKNFKNLKSVALLMASIGLALSMASKQNWKQILAAGAGMAACMLSISKVIEDISKIDKTDMAGVITITSYISTLAFVFPAIGSAMKKVAEYNWLQIAVAAAGVSICMLAMGGVLKIISTIEADDLSMKVVAGILALAIALGPIGTAMAKIAAFNWIQIGVSALGLVAAIGGLALVIYELSKIDKKNIGTALAATAGILLASLAMIPIANAIEQLAKYEWGQLWPPLVAMAGVIVALGAALAALTALGTGTGGVGAAVILAAAAAIWICGKAVLDIADACVRGSEAIKNLAQAFVILSHDVDISNIVMWGKELINFLKEFDEVAWSAIKAAAALAIGGSGFLKFAQGLQALANVDISNVSNNIVKIFDAVGEGMSKLQGWGVELEIFAHAFSVFGDVLKGIALASIALGAGLLIAGVGIIAAGAGLKLMAEPLQVLQGLDWATLAFGLTALSDAFLKFAAIGAVLSLFSDGLVMTAIAMGAFAAECYVFASFIDLKVVADGLLAIAGSGAALGAAGVVMLAGSIGVGAMAVAITALGLSIGGAAILIAKGIDAIVTAVEKLKGLKTAGTNAVQGFINGVIQKVPDAIKSGLSLASGFYNAVTKFLGIASPSKALRVVGNFTGSGFILGIADMMDEAEASGKSLGLSALTGIEGYEDLFGAEGSKCGLSFVSSLDSIISPFLGKASGFSRTGANGMPSGVADKISKGGMSGLNNILDDTIGKLFDISDVSKKVEEATKGAAGGVDALGDSTGKAGKKAKEAKDEIASFYDKIESSISLFDEFKKEDPMDPAQLIQNMKSQIEGIAGWSTQIQQLATKGIDQGLLKKLADMGPQSYKYTQAFVNMTSEQLAEANKYFEQSLLLPQHVTAQIYGSYEIAGQNAAEGFIGGLSKEDVKAEGVKFAYSFLDNLRSALGIHSPSKETESDGRNVTQGMINGITWPTSLHNLENATTRMCFKITDTIDQKLKESEFITIGRNVVAGIEKGIEDQGVQSSLFDKVRQLCQKVITIAKSPQGFNEHSPSRVFQQIGRYVTEGLAIGISENTNMATSAIKDLATNAVSNMQNAIDTIQNIVNGDLDVEPVIRPVLDMDDLNYGLNSINSIMNDNLTPSITLNNQNPIDYITQANLVNNNADVVAAVESLKEDVAYLGDAMTNIKMVLDTGTMVGAMTPAIDQQLGMRQVYAGRGI